MEYLRQVLSQLSAVWERLSPWQRLSLALVGAIVVAAIAAVSFVGTGGRYVPLSTLLNDVPYAMKVSRLRTELGGEMVTAIFSSKVARLIGRLTGGAG